MLSPFPIFLRSATTAASSPSTTTTMNDNSDNLSDIIDLFPYTAPTYEPPPSRPPRNPDRLKNEYIPFIDRRAPPRFPPPTSPLPPLPPDSVTPSQQLNKLPQPMYPTPGGLSPWSAPSYPSKPIPTSPSSSLPQSTFILRGPVGVLPLSRAAPGAPTTKQIPNSPRAEDNFSPSDAALVLNVHGGIDTSSRLHHGFRRHQVPYPRNYERNVLDLDAVDTLLTRQMSGGSLTWHVFPPSWNKPPPDVPLKRILDIGSGNGVWVVEAAKHWKGCEVVGLDVVSLHPDLVRLSRDKDLLKRVSWVQANFLDGLPFANDSFDFVHIKRIARGVPEDKWDDLFEEITRVMKPGAAFEVVEEDLTFPGRSDGEGSEVGTLRSKESNISMSTSSRSPGTESGRDSASSSSDSAGSMSAVTTPDSIPSISINTHPHRSNVEDPSDPKPEREYPTISISLPTNSLSMASNNTHANAFIHRSLRRHPSGNISHETLTLARPSTTSPSSPSSQPSPPLPSSQPPLPSPSQPFPSSSSSQSTFFSFSSNSSTPTPSTMNQTLTPSLTPRPPPSHKFNKAAQAVLMEPTHTPFFVGLGSVTASGSSGSSSASVSGSVTGSGSLFASGSSFGTSPSSGNGTGTSSTSSSGSPPVPQKRNKAAQAVLMEPTTTPFFVLPQNKSRVSLMGESSSSGSSSGRDSHIGKGRSRGSLGSRVSVGLGNLGFGARSNGGVGSPSSSSKVLEDELGEETEAQFPVGTPPDSRGGAALDSGSVVSPPLDARGIVPLDSRGVVPPDPRGVIPPDPRDHTVLETIYNEMHSERFINLSPLSLLANTVGLWFKGECLSFIPSFSGGADVDKGGITEGAPLQVGWAYISGLS
ncbi:hypothetical protein F4604DRAFT_1729673 [Suillus subluteus]|nr:hypothetical protein F4604DRAFT_1729673 [Suillus subluteus]